MGPIVRPKTFALTRLCKQPPICLSSYLSSYLSSCLSYPGVCDGCVDVLCWILPVPICTRAICATHVPACASTRACVCCTCLYRLHVPVYRHLAAQKGHLPFMEVLIKNGAPIDQQNWAKMCVHCTQHGLQCVTDSSQQQKQTRGICSLKWWRMQESSQ
jgi:hypothetical protein